MGFQASRAAALTFPVAFEQLTTKMKGQVVATADLCCEFLLQNTLQLIFQVSTTQVSISLSLIVCVLPQMKFFKMHLITVVSAGVFEVTVSVNISGGSRKS